MMRPWTIFLTLFLAVFAVMAQADDLESLVTKLASDEARARSEACYQLGKLGKDGEPAVEKIAMLLARDKNPNVRLMAAQALGDIAIQVEGSPGENPRFLVGVLRKALADTDARVRLQAAQSLGNFGKNADPASEALAMVATSDGDPKVRRTAIATLGTIGHHGGPESGKALPYLKKALSDPDPEIRRLTAYVLSRFGEASRPLIPKLMETLREGPDRAQKEAARTLGTYGPAAIAAVPVLFDKLKQESHLSLRSEAAESIIRIDPTRADEVATILVAGTRSNDSGVRFFALDGLLQAVAEPAQIAQHVKPTLKRLASDEIVEIRLRATEALEDLEEKAGQAPKVEPAPANENPKEPEILLEDSTAEEAEAAMARVRAFVTAWEKGTLDEAAAMVDERLRLAFRKEMGRDPLRVRAIESLRVFRSRGALRARARIAKGPKGGVSLDLVFREGQWWITGG